MFEKKFQTTPNINVLSSSNHSINPSLPRSAPPPSVPSSSIATPNIANELSVEETPGIFQLHRSRSTPNVSQKHFLDDHEPSAECSSGSSSPLFLDRPLTREVTCHKNKNEQFGAKLAFVDNNFYVIDVTFSHYLFEDSATMGQHSAASQNQNHGQQTQTFQQSHGQNTSHRAPLQSSTGNRKEPADLNNILKKNMNGSYNIKEPAFLVCDTPAERLGLAFGDRILSVNQIKARTLTMKSLYGMLTASSTLVLKIQDAKSLGLHMEDLFSASEIYDLRHPHLHKMDKELGKIAQNHKKHHHHKNVRHSLSLSRKKKPSTPELQTTFSRSAPSSPPSERKAALETPASTSSENMDRHRRLTLEPPLRKSRKRANSAGASSSVTSETSAMTSETTVSAPSSAASSAENSPECSPPGSTGNSPSLSRKSSRKTPSTAYTDNKHNFLNYHNNRVNSLDGYNVSTQIKSISGCTIIQIDGKVVVHLDNDEVVDMCMRHLKKNHELSITVAKAELALSLKAAYLSLKLKY